MKGYISSLKEDEHKNLKDVIKPYKDENKIFQYDDNFIINPYITVKVIDKFNHDSFSWNGYELKYEGNYHFDDIYTYSIPDKEDIENEIRGDGDYDIEVKLYYIEITKNEADIIIENKEEDVIEEILDRDYTEEMIESIEIETNKSEATDNEIEKIKNELIEMLDEYGGKLEYSYNESKSTKSIYFTVDIYDNGKLIDDKEIRISDHASNVGESKDFNIMVGSKLYNKRGFEDLMTSEDSIDDVRLWIEDTLENLSVNENKNILKEDEHKNLKDILKPYKDSDRILYNSELDEYWYVTNINDEISVYNIRTKRKLEKITDEDDDDDYDGSLYDRFFDYGDSYAIDELFDEKHIDKIYIDYETYYDYDYDDDYTAEYRKFLEYVKIEKEDLEKIYAYEMGDGDEYGLNDYYDRDDLLGKNNEDYITIYNKELEVEKDDTLERAIENLNEKYNEVIELLEEYKDNLEYHVNEAKSTDSKYIRVTLFDNDEEIDEKTIRISDHAPNRGESKDFNIMVDDEFYNKRDFGHEVNYYKNDIYDIREWIEDTLNNLPIKEFKSFSEWKKLKYVERI